jgi:hypothetical protein
MKNPTKITAKIVTSDIPQTFRLETLLYRRPGLYIRHVAVDALDHDFTANRSCCHRLSPAVTLGRPHGPQLVRLPVKAEGDPTGVLVVADRRQHASNVPLESVSRIVFGVRRRRRGGAPNQPMRSGTGQATQEGNYCEPWYRHSGTRRPRTHVGQYSDDDEERRQRQRPGSVAELIAPNLSLNAKKHDANPEEQASEKRNNGSSSQRDYPRPAPK